MGVSMPVGGDVSRASRSIEIAARRARDKIIFSHKNRERWVGANDLVRIQRALEKGKSFDPFVRVRLLGQNRGPAELVHYKVVISDICESRQDVSLHELIEQLGAEKHRPVANSESTPGYVRCHIDGQLFYARITEDLCLPMTRVFGHFKGEKEDGCVCFDIATFSSLEDCQAAGIVGPSHGRVIVVGMEGSPDALPLAPRDRPFVPETNVWPD